eukprot:scaffold8.g1679.t1
MARTPLHDAAEQGDVAAVRRILAAAPGDAMAATTTGILPLHMACLRGHTAAAELLLAAAPEAALATTQHGSWLPLHYAARYGHTALVGLLLGAAPDTERRRTVEGESALFLAAFNGHLHATCILLERSTAAPAGLIVDLVVAKNTPFTLMPAHEVFLQLADLAARRALSPADWAALPTPCPGLARALPAILARSPAEAAQLVAHLPAAARGRLHALLLSLARVQRQLRLELPEAVVRRILAAAQLEAEGRRGALRLWG